MSQMASETLHIVQAYVAGRNGALTAESPVGCKDAEEARRKAERLAGNRLGVAAYSITADEEAGDYDDTPQIHFRAGQPPPNFDDM